MKTIYKIIAFATLMSVVFFSSCDLEELESSDVGGAKLKVKTNLSPSVTSADNCYNTGDVWTIVITSGPTSVSSAEVTLTLTDYIEGEVTISGFTESGTYYFDVIDNYNDKVESGSNYFSSSEVEKEYTDTKTVYVSLLDAGC